MVECILNKYKHRIYKSVLRGDKWYMILCFILSISMWIKSILSYYSIIQLVLRVFSCALLCVPVCWCALRFDGNNVGRALLRCLYAFFVYSDVYCSPISIFRINAI